MDKKTEKRKANKHDVIDDVRKIELKINYSIETIERMWKTVFFFLDETDRIVMG